MIISIEPLIEEKINFYKNPDQESYMTSHNCKAGPKYCPLCGAEIDFGARICRFCHTNLKTGSKEKLLLEKQESFYKTLKSDKKNFIIIIITSLLIVSFVFNNILMFLGKDVSAPLTVENKLFVGTIYAPSVIDPIHSTGTPDEDVIFQVCEGLFMHNLSDPNLEIVPRLARDFGRWDTSLKHYTIALRRNVFFHDGTKLNASVVKWNFERINYFLNATGTLIENLTVNSHLFKFPNATYIFDTTTPVSINSEYSVTLNLNAPFTVLESLLCHVSTYLISPKSTPQYEIIDTNSGDLIGTGPFGFDHYIKD